MPIYNTKTTALALGVTPKWLDNLLSHNQIPALQADSQGVSRRLSLTSVQIIALARELIGQLELSAPVALRVATQLLEDDAGKLALSPSLQLTLQLAAFRANLVDQLDRAVEVAPTPRRGRPRKA